MLADAPLISKAWVVNYETEQRLLYVICPSGQVPMPVKMLFNGPADALSVHQVEMPKIGTMGLVLFPNGDSRSGFWLGSIYNSGTNAITSGSNTPFENYNSYWCGAFDYLDEDGNFTKWLPEGTYFQVSEVSGVPILYRHNYDNTAYPPEIQRKEFPLSERIPNPPPAKQVLLHHTSGTEHLIDASGNVSTTLSSGKSYSVKVGQTSVSVDASGNMALDVRSGQTFTINCAGVQIHIDSSGTVNIGLANGQEAPALASKIISNLYIPHTHVDSTGGTTTGPSQPVQDSAIASTRIKTDS